MNRTQSTGSTIAQWIVFFRSFGFHLLAYLLWLTRSPTPPVAPTLPIDENLPSKRPSQMPPRCPKVMSNAVSAASTETLWEVGRCPDSSSYSVESSRRQILGGVTAARSVGFRRSANGPSHRRCSSAQFDEGPAHLAFTLRRAVLRKELGSVKSLISHWPNNSSELEEVLIDRTDDEGYTLIHAAVTSRSAIILATLLQLLPTQEARQRAARSSGSSHNKYTPLHLASLKGDAESARILLDQGADPNALSKV